MTFNAEALQKDRSLLLRALERGSRK